MVLTRDEEAIIKAVIADDKAEAEEKKYPDVNAGYGYPQPEEKHNAWTFLKQVMIIPSTLRVGNLTQDEVGLPHFPLRALKNQEHIAGGMIGNDFSSKYIAVDAEDLTATSLSKDAKLIGLSISQQRILNDASKPRVINKSWFKKEPTEGGSE